MVVARGRTGAGAVAGIREVTVNPAGVVDGGITLTTGAAAVTATGVVVVTTAADRDKGKSDGAMNNGTRGAAKATTGAGAGGGYQGL
ncbi:MAG: hypothetical protein AB1847_04870 [bacterium]